MSEQATGTAEVDASGAGEELTQLQQALELLTVVSEASSFEEGNAFALKSIAHSVLHIAKTQSAGDFDLMPLYVLCAKWERLAREAQADDEASDHAVRGVFAQCASEVRALLGDER